MRDIQESGRIMIGSLIRGFFLNRVILLSSLNGYWTGKYEWYFSNRSISSCQIPFLTTMHTPHRRSIYIDTMRCSVFALLRSENAKSSSCHSSPTNQPTNQPTSQPQCNAAPTSMRCGTDPRQMPLSICMCHLCVVIGCQAPIIGV